MQRFVAIKIDATDARGKGAELKNKKFRVAAIPFMVYYASSEVADRETWFAPKRQSGALSTEEFLAMLKSVR